MFRGNETNNRTNQQNISRQNPQSNENREAIRLYDLKQKLIRQNEMRSKSGDKNLLTKPNKQLFMKEHHQISPRCLNQELRQRFNELKLRYASNVNPHQIERQQESNCMINQTIRVSQNHVSRANQIKQPNTQVIALNNIKSIRS